MKVITYEPCPDPVVSIGIKYGPMGNVFLAGRCQSCGRWSYGADAEHRQAYTDAVAWIGLIVRNAYLTPIKDRDQGEAS